MFCERLHLVLNLTEWSHKGKANLSENAASEKYAKQMPSGFTHFYCRVVLSPIAGRLVAAR